MMKAPERITSTPRLIAVILTIATTYLVCTSKMEVKDFIPLFMGVLCYFFGSRGSEPTKLPDSTTQVTSTKTPPINPDESIPSQNVL